MLGLGDRLGIDLGTSNIVVYAWRRGIVIREPSVVAARCAPSASKLRPCWVGPRATS